MRIGRIGLRTLLAGAILALTLPFGDAGRAQQKTLYVAAYGGSFEQVLRKQVFPGFEKKYGVHVEYVAGNSTDNLARLQAQKGGEQIDVAVLDDGPMYQATAFGFCRPLAKAPIYDALYPLAKIPSGKAVLIGIVGTGIMYNKTYFAEHHWPAPTSWNDLEDPKYKGKLVIPPLNNTYGLHALVEFAKLGGGGEKNIEPGFKAFQDQVGQFELRQIQRNVGITTVLVTHDQAEAMALSDRIAIMNMGRVEQIARPDCAYERPASPFVAGFLGKSNRLSGRIEAGSVRIADAAWPAPAGFAAGEVAVTVRPEKIGFAADGLRGAVRTRLFLGSQWLFQIDTPAGLVLVIRQSTGTAVPAEGEAVSLAWRPEDMRIARAEVPAS